MAFIAERIIFEPNSEILMQRGGLFRQPVAGKLIGKTEPEDLGLQSQLVNWTRGNRAKLAPAEPVLSQIETGFLLNGQFSATWYHWLINVLPRLYLAERSGLLPIETPVLVPALTRGTQFEEALDCLRHPGREVFFVPDGPHEVGKAFIMETPAREVYNPLPRRGKLNWSRLGDFNFEIMKEYRNHILQRTDFERIERKEDCSRILMTRADWETKRPYNQPDVQEVLEEFGFVSVDFGQLDFRSQVSLMHGAEIVVGPTGSSWANFMFSEKAKGVIFLPRFLHDSPLFAKLGALGGSELFNLDLQTEYSTWGKFFAGDQPSRVDVVQLRELIWALVD